MRQNVIRERNGVSNCVADWEKENEETEKACKVIRYERYRMIETDEVIKCIATGSITEGNINTYIEWIVRETKHSIRAR